MRVVASTTTLPGREKVLEAMINSLLEQTLKLDKIYLTIPAKAERLGKRYNPPSEFLKAHCEIIEIPRDFGPITKIFGAVTREDDPKTLILSCDDDVIFPPTLVEKLCEKNLARAAKGEQAVICGTGALLSHGVWFISIVSSVQPFHTWKGFTGVPVSDEGRKIDLVFGVGGVLYPRSTLPIAADLEKEFWTPSLSDSDIFHNDDVLISGYLSRMGTPRRVYLDIPSITHASGEGALSANVFKMLARMWRAVEKVQKLGCFPIFESYSVTETPVYRGALVVLLVVILVLLIVACMLE